jgi:glycosyltransferase involved in cell wall biosynthesis
VAATKNEKAAPVTAPRIRIYGHARAEHSFGQVTRGMVRAVMSIGELAGTWALDAEPGDHDDPDVLRGDGAPVALVFGGPTGLMAAHRFGSHKSHWLLLAPNSESLPKGLAEYMTQPSEVLPRGLLTGGLLAPSSWAAGVLRRCVPDRPVIVAPHGVTPDIHKTDPRLRDSARARFAEGAFDVLHMTSSETERKSTKLLLRAWQDARRRRMLPHRAQLHVVMNPTQMNRIKWWCADLGLGDDEVKVHPGLAYSQSDVAQMYGQMHVVCQPSRGEGFGLCVLESLACGVPIVATICTGHSEFLSETTPGLTVVPHGLLAPMDDFQGSVAPYVTAEEIAYALGCAVANWRHMAEAAEQHAETLRTEWSWEKKNGPAIRRLLQEVENVRAEQ